MSELPTPAGVDTLRPSVAPERAQRFGRLTRRAAILRYSPRNMAPMVRMEKLIDFEPAYAWVAELNRERTRARRITLNHVTVKAIAQALRNHIFFNYAYDGGRRLHAVEQIDIRTPVDLGDFPQHVVVPRTDTLSVQEIADTLYRLRDQLTGTEMTPIERRMAVFELPWPVVAPVIWMGEGLRWVRRFFPRAQATALARQREWFGSFMVSNVGTLGADGGAGVITRPSIAACAFWAVQPQPLVHEGEVVVRRAGKLSVGFDHRFVDAAQATRFLYEVRRNLLEPAVYLTKDPAPPMFPGSIGGVLP